MGASAHDHAARAERSGEDPATHPLRREEVTRTPIDASGLARHQASTDAAAGRLVLPRASAAAHALLELRELLADARQMLEREVAQHMANDAASVPRRQRAITTPGIDVPPAPPRPPHLRGIERQLTVLRDAVAHLAAPQADAMARFLRRATAFAASLEWIGELLHGVVAG